MVGRNVSQAERFVLKNLSNFATIQNFNSIQIFVQKLNVGLLRPNIKPVAYLVCNRLYLLPQKLLLVLKRKEMSS